MIAMDTDTKPGLSAITDQIRHLYCMGRHERIVGQEHAFCGAIRNKPHAGIVLIAQLEHENFCLVCTDIIKHGGSLCAACRKGKK